MPRKFVALVTLASLSLALTGGCSNAEAPILVETVCQNSFVPLAASPLNKDGMLRSLENCASRDEWVSAGVEYLPAPYRGSDSEARQLLDDVCLQDDYLDTSTCLN